jgi:LmbE family N-acetylglucosaminyl deacetylase
MVFAPHPDDEILGCFGAIVSHLNKEEEVSVVYMTSGEAGDNSVSPLLLKRTREQEAKKVMSSLGIKRYFFMGLPDGEIRYDSSTVKMVADVIVKWDPVYVYVPNGEEPHKDHKTACRVVTDALRSLALDNRCFEIRYYEVWRSLYRFNLVIDISSLAENKKKHIRMYKSQLKNVRYDQEILAINKKRGSRYREGSFCEVYDCYRISSKKTERIGLASRSDATAIKRRLKNVLASLLTRMRGNEER